MMSRTIRSIAVIAMASASPLAAHAAVTETVLYSFETVHGMHPHSGLVVDKTGAFYGTTLHGGKNSLGTVYKFADGKLTVLYSFKGNRDGAFPNAGVTLDKSGNLIGATQGADVSSDFGTIFSIAPDGTENVLHRFKNVPDGNSPQSELILGPDGKYYGTAASGAIGAGDVFSVSRGGHLSVIYSFGAGVDGGNPAAKLLSDGSGTFYSTTYNNGAHGLGTVFDVTSGGSEHVVYSFAGGADGRNPATGVIADAAGNLYGTTYFGGPSDAGTVFKVAHDGTETVLHAFTGADGANPLSDLLMDKRGNIYGTANQGGANGEGTVFEITAAGKFKTLYSFLGGDSGDGENPAGDLYMDKQGTIYSTTMNGGANVSGTIFKLTTK
jgi:uncharacterized repeat protein (TIGR03803 family)